ncbi:hypothetical protein OUZ56_011509 [Daphnia magna]|uniref:Uncharacterized protein n=1 Tax=Daphnia magna TaxID=35525 RepID=A0ABQ9Z1M0_9CRUS|nr:hypothetical protein OUZ56_011509 [Daphnia magna]
MIGEEDVRSGERIRDVRGWFVARVSWGIPEIGSAPQGRARTRSQPLRESGTEERGEIEDGANEPQQEQQPVSVRQEYHLTFSEEETERREDAEEEEGSGEHGEEQLEWDLRRSDLRRRSSNISSYIRGFRAAQQQVGARHAMAAQIKFQSPPTFGGKDGEDVVQVDPNMSEATKLAHLWRGLKPSLLEKLWSLKPNSCDEFLQEIKRYQEMTSRARHEEWAMGAVVKQTPTAGISVDGKEIQPGGVAMLSVSDGRMTVEGEALVLDGDIDLLLGKDMLEKLGTRMKIGALPEIFIGDIAIGALVEEMTEEAPKLVVQNGCWVPPRSRKVVATQPLDLKGFGEGALVEPSQALQKTERVSTGKVLVSGVGTIGQMAITHLSDHKQWIEEGTVLGIIEPVTEIKEGDTPVAVATAGAEKKARREHEFESRIGEGLMPTDREKIREVLGEYGDYFSWPGDQLGLCTAAKQTIEAGGKDIRDREVETRETIPLDEEVQEARNERIDDQVRRST